MRKKWRQGIFVPKNQDKFIGTKATYRSGLELKFFRFCDDSSNVLKWGSENVVVPYRSPLDNGKQLGIIVKSAAMPLLLLQKRSFIIRSD